MFCTEWLLACRYRIVYERRPDNQVFYVLPVELILGKLPVAPVGETGTIPYCMRHSMRRILSALHSIPEVIYQHLGLELVARTRREMNKLSLLFCIF